MIETHDRSTVQQPESQHRCFGLQLQLLLKYTSDLQTGLQDRRTGASRDCAPHQGEAGPRHSQHPGTLTS